MKEGREGVCGHGTVPLKHGEAIKVDGDDHHNNDHNNDNPQATAHCEKLFRLIDIDGDGNLTEAEFLRVELDFIIIYSLSYHTS